MTKATFGLVSTVGNMRDTVHFLISFPFGWAGFSVRSLLERYCFLPRRVDRVGFVGIELGEDLLNVSRLWQFNGLLMSISLYFEA